MDATTTAGFDAETIERLADLTVGFAANVQRGQIVAIGAEMGKQEMVRALAASAYRHGAKFVDPLYFDMHVKRARILHAEEDTLDFVPSWYGDRMLEFRRQRCARIGIPGPPRAGPPAVRADRRRRPRHAGPAGRPRSGPRRARPAARAEGDRRRRQRGDDEL